MNKDLSGGKTRCWPQEGSHLERKLGVRLDWGTQKPFKGQNGYFYRDLNLQINKNSENNTLKELAKNLKGSHKKRYRLLIRTDKDGNVVITEPQLRERIRCKFVKMVSERGL